MIRTYITTVPLQGPRALEKTIYRRAGDTAPVLTRFPILQVLADTAKPQDELHILAIRQENADTERNYALLLQELAAQGIREAQVTTIALPENQNVDTLLKLCGDLVRTIPDVGRVYACITYGTKSIPVVLLSALACAEKTHTEMEVGEIVYGEIQRENGNPSRNAEGVVEATLYDMSALYHLSGMVGQMPDGTSAEAMLDHLLWLNEHKEG